MSEVNYCTSLKSGRQQQTKHKITYRIQDLPVYRKSLVHFRKAPWLAARSRLRLPAVYPSSLSLKSFLVAETIVLHLSFTSIVVFPAIPSALTLSIIAFHTATLFWFVKTLENLSRMISRFSSASCRIKVHSEGAKLGFLVLFAFSADDVFKLLAKNRIYIRHFT